MKEGRAGGGEAFASKEACLLSPREGFSPHRTPCGRTMSLWRHLDLLGWLLAKIYSIKVNVIHGVAAYDLIYHRILLKT
jgi:hypothetical protein